MSKIKRLDETVVNRIAAGEIIQRPANALKELIENSLDAGATNIQILVADGGLKKLQIIDNGHGVQSEDLPILCERFTTSKLKEFEDLKQIATFGFRGEALASMSHVSHLSVITKTAESPCAWKAEYYDGKLINPKSGVNPKACAGNIGTTITMCDLFYNVPTRRKALSNLNDEYLRIVDVVGRYALHCPKVSFLCKKQGSSTSDIQTMSTDDRVATVRNIFGSKPAKELIHFESKNDELDFSFDVLASKLTYGGKKYNFFLFVNDRAVESPSFKSQIKNLYSQFLPKGSYPFIYLSIKVPPHKVDVNMHPTKRQVAILNEDSIYSIIVDTLSEELSKVNDSRVYYTQSLINDTGALQTRKRAIEDSQESPLTQKSTRKVNDNEYVRVDSKETSINSFLYQNSQSSKISVNKPTIEPSKTINDVISGKKTLKQMFGVGSTISPVSKLIEEPISSKNVHQESISSFLINPKGEPSLYKDSRTILESQEPINVSKEITGIEVQASKSKSKADNQKSWEQIKQQDHDSFLNNLSLYGKEEIPTTEKIKEGLENIEPNNCIEKREKDMMEPTNISLADNTVIENTKESSLYEEKVVIPNVPEADGIVFTDVKLTSINSMADQIMHKTHEAAQDVIKNHVFVGFVDDFSALIQHETSLYILNYSDAFSELIYQLVIRGFANFGKISFTKPLDIADLIQKYLDLIDINDLQISNNIDKDNIITGCVNILNERSDMLNEYYSIKIENGKLLSIPVIIRNYLPDMTKLPQFLLRICSEVNWDDEYYCLNGISRELGNFYRPSKNTKREEIELILFRSLKLYWRPSYAIVDNKCLLRISNLKNLYKVFERC